VVRPGNFLDILIEIYEDTAADKNFISMKYFIYYRRLKLITQELDGVGRMCKVLKRR
jgi:hypothetical protein